MMKPAHNIAVLMYHHVTEHGGSLSVSAQNFEHQILGLARKGYRALRADEFAAFLDGAPMPKKSVVITFDDGYLDNWVYAHPVLARYGMTALLFTVTGLIGQGPVRPHAGQGKTVPNCPPHDQAQALMQGSNPDSVMLRWDEIQEMTRAGSFEIHSHTHTHTRWDYRCDSIEERDARFQEDLEASRDALNTHLGHVSSHLCWPQGYFNDTYKQIAAAQGFRHLYTTDARGQNTLGGDASHIYRLATRNRRASWLNQRIWLATHPFWGPRYNAWKAAGNARKRAG